MDDPIVTSYKKLIEVIEKSIVLRNKQKINCWSAKRLLIAVKRTYQQYELMRQF